MTDSPNAQTPEKQPKTLFQRVNSALLTLAAAPVGLWCGAAIYYGLPFGKAFSIVVLVAYVLVWPLCLWRVGRGDTRRLFIVVALMIVGMWQFKTPSNDRDWSADQAQMPFVEIEDDLATVHNLRYAAYRSASDYDVTWYTQRFDLEQVVGVDFIVEPFDLRRPGLAHTLLSFAFADGEHLAVSVEIRREKGEAFHPVPGLFRQYEVVYVAGDERDLIGLRTEIRKNPVHVYPLRATPEDARALFVAVLKHMNQLYMEPEFYNSLTNTCMTHILRRVEEATGRSLGFDLRIALPGYSDELAHEIGAIDFDGTLAEARRRFKINDRAALGDPPADRIAYSRQIRRLPDTPTPVE